jgi:hypothetical protein
MSLEETDKLFNLGLVGSRAHVVQSVNARSFGIFHFEDINKSCLSFQKTTMGLVLPSTTREVRRHVKKLSVFERLEWSGAEVLRKSTATLQQTHPSPIFLFASKLLN